MTLIKSVTDTDTTRTYYVRSQAMTALNMCAALSAVSYLVMKHQFSTVRANSSAQLSHLKIQISEARACLNALGPRRTRCALPSAHFGQRTGVT